MRGVSRFKKARLLLVPKFQKPRYLMRLEFPTTIILCNKNKW